MTKKKQDLTIADVFKNIGRFFKNTKKAFSKDLLQKVFYFLPILTFILPLVFIWALGEVKVGPVAFQFTPTLSKEKVQIVAQEYIKENFSSGQKVTIGNVNTKNGLYSFNVEINGQEFPSYMTKNGNYLIPQVYEIGDFAQEVLAKKTDLEKSDTKKSDRPSVELFVMSYCPYGTQAEKGILPAVNLLKNKIDFKLRFVDYAMHDKKELDENLKQYCIQKNEPERLTAYLDCFLQGESRGEVCLGQTNIDQAKLAECVESTDEEYQITANYNDHSTWRNGTYPIFAVEQELNEKYGVGGSPTLVINGEQSSSSRNPAAYLETICAGFNNPPEECNQELSNATPQPGFGSATTNSGSEATCN